MTIEPAQAIDVFFSYAHEDEVLRDELAKQPVTIHIYTSTLKVEYQDTDLALYTLA